MRHIIGISGGKDSAALAIYLRRKRDDWRYFHDLLAGAGQQAEADRIKSTRAVPELECFFADTGKELPEVYEYLDILEKYLDAPVVRLSPFANSADANISPFDHFLKSEHGGLLPSQQQRWCTYKMKLKPMEKFVGKSEAINYVGIRADEGARVKLSSMKNITAVYPFIADRLVRQDILDLLEATAGIPKYYEWRSRSGCYFCFFQRRSEWLGLRDRHPDLFKRAMAYEENTYDEDSGRMYTWNQDITLRELEKLPSVAPAASEGSDRSQWQTILLKNLEDDDPHDQACTICSL